MRYEWKRHPVKKCCSYFASQHCASPMAVARIKLRWISGSKLQSNVINEILRTRDRSISSSVMQFADPEKIRELARRGEAWGDSECRQMLEHSIETGRSGVYLRLIAWGSASDFAFSTRFPLRQVVTVAEDIFRQRTDMFPLDRAHFGWFGTLGPRTWPWRPDPSPGQPAPDGPVRGPVAPLPAQLRPSPRPPLRLLCRPTSRAGTAL
jgi:hypothetical protein